MRNKLMMFLHFIFSGNKKIIKGENNNISLKSSRIKKVLFDIKGDNNTVIIGNNASLNNCKIIIRGHNHHLYIGNNTSLRASEIKFEDHDCRIKIGDNTKVMKHCEISAVEPYMSIEIGDDCLLSSHIDIRTTDSHSIINRMTKERINPGKSIIIGNKVWIGSHVQILKGVIVGDNSVIGSRSVVTKEVPTHCLIAGVPAKVIKDNIEWREKRI